ncbi:MAG: HD domain-containing protein [Flavobacteriales bacterium]
MDQRAAKSHILSRLRHELPAARTYHSFEHTLDVYASAITIAEQEGVSGEDLELLKTAALFHDSGFLVQGNGHEEGSCSIAREALPRFGYSQEQVERVCGSIMATRLPQEPHEPLARILCDADLDYLGRDDFFSIGATLFEEMRTYGALTTEREWNELQLRFLEQHRYFTDTSRWLREPVKQQHLATLRKWLASDR